MTAAAAALAVLLSYAILSIWIEDRWAWSVAQIAVFAGVAGWAARQWRQPSSVQFSVWLAPLCCAPIWGLVQLAAHGTVYRWGTWNAVLNWTTWLAFFFVALQVFRDREGRKWFLQFAVYFGFGMSVLATLTMLTSHGRYFWLFPSGYQDFVLGPFVYRNQYAAFMETILPIALWQALRGKRSLANFAMAAAMLASVVASATRAGAVLMCAEVIAVLVLVWLQGARGGAVARALVIFGGMAAVGAGIAGWQLLWQRLRDPDPLAVRRELVLSSVAMLRDRPGMGFGLGNWPRAYPQYALFDDGNYVNQAHNDWMQWAVEGGVPFLLILLSLVAMAAPAALGSVWGIGLLSVWVHCLVEYPLQQRPGIAAWFFVLLGLLAADRASDRRRRFDNSL